MQLCDTYLFQLNVELLRVWLACKVPEPLCHREYLGLRLDGKADRFLNTQDD